MRSQTSRWKTNFNLILTEILSLVESGKKYSEEFTTVYEWLFKKQRYSIEKEYLEYYSCAYTAHKLLSKLNHSLLDDGEIYYAFLTHNDHIVDQRIIFDKHPQINDFSYESYILSRNFILKRNGLSPITENDLKIGIVAVDEFLQHSDT